MVLDSSGWFWLGLAGSGWFQLVGFGRFWMTVAGFRVVVVNSGWSWLVDGGEDEEILTRRRGRRISRQER